ncbi:MAG TPA: porphobilinogen synthase [Elusimicrobiota bacterium]|nr:porphobilinogen synthase [Elusimicrobiota bacterium]
MAFPATRMRRLRINPLVRSRLQETDISPERLIAPFFVRSGKGVRRPIGSMPGQFQWSIDYLVDEVGRLHRKGLRSVLLFGLPDRKNERGSQAWASAGIVQRAVRRLKSEFPGLLVITDLCFCEYTSHGHCGIVRRSSAGARRRWELDNDATLASIAKTAVAQARAGADVIAPSGMIDGMVGTIRRALDRRGFEHVLIMSYAAKFASAFYGPFREAAGSAPQFGTRHSYQMNPANADEALREVGLDIEEGADIVMVKPALCYLDIIRRVKEIYRVPVAAYNVSGEYAMVKAAGRLGWIDEAQTAREILIGIRRAGADLIITYHAAAMLNDR